MDNLLKESLVYLESIPKGDHKLIMLIHRIKKKLNPENYKTNTDCKHCCGTGFVDKFDGHDCWGKAEYKSVKCSHCLGTGKVLG
jgi:DnaJ-class molecular chaperone